MWVFGAWERKVAVSRGTCSVLPDTQILNHELTTGFLTITLAVFHYSIYIEYYSVCAIRALVSVSWTRLGVWVEGKVVLHIMCHQKLGVEWATGLLACLCLSELLLPVHTRPTVTAPAVW